MKTILELWRRLMAPKSKPATDGTILSMLLASSSDNSPLRMISENQFERMQAERAAVRDMLEKRRAYTDACRKLDEVMQPKEPTK